MRRVSIYAILFVMLLSILPAGPMALAQQEDIYEDPSGLFTAPVPTSWTAESREGYGLLTDPDDAIKVYVLAVDASDAAEGIAAAWQVVQPDFDLEIEDSVSVPPTGDYSQFDEVVQTSYRTPEERGVLAVGLRLQDKVYAILFDADKDAGARRASQLGIIASGFSVTGQEKADLTGGEPKPVDEVMAGELGQYIADAMQRAGVPGAVVAIVQNGEIVFEQAYGVKELGKPDPVLPTTRMMIGSTGKSITTLMMATIVDAGKMTWDTPAIEILPSFAVADPQLSQEITMRNLVCACTGVPRRDLELIFNANELDAEKIVASLETFEFFTDFGEAFQYSNQMVGTGGYIAAVAGGGDPDDLLAAYISQLQQRVLDPIGMTHTTLSFDEVVASDDYAMPHGLNLFNERFPIPFSYEKILLPIAPAGAHWSTASDMARYLITLMNEGVSPDGERVVSTKNLNVLWEPQVAIDSETSYALGWSVGKYKGLPLIEHGGATFGFSAELALLPESKLGIVVLSNGQAAGAFNQAVRTRLFELVFDQPFDGETNFAFTLDFLKENVAETMSQIEDLDSAAVEPYLGTFTDPALGRITLSLEDGKLALNAGEFKSELRVWQDEEGEISYVTFDPPVAGAPFKLEEDDDGRPIVVLSWPPDTYRFVKESLSSVERTF